MENIIDFVGIDISKDFFDVFSSDGRHRQFPNSADGFADLLDFSGSACHYVMEATGVYHLRLAVYLFEQGVAVSVVNPLIVKRFVQMHLKSNKTDKSDAKMIQLYGSNQQPTLWRPAEAYISQSRDLFELLELLIKSRTSLKNRLHAVESKGFGDALSAKLLKQSIAHLNDQAALLEAEMEALVRAHEPELYSRLQSIPGLGKKTALMLILLTEAFKDFENAGQVSSYIGLAPSHQQSGSSVRGRTKISKQGNSKMRNLLFMCSFNACKHNKACRELYERIVAKGKSKKLALVAVANKLIRQAFAIAKSGLPYDEGFRSTRPSL